jgi:hypothetical protein
VALPESDVSKIIMLQTIFVTLKGDMIDSGDPFARFLGARGCLHQLSKETQNRFFELIEKDMAFAWGCGCAHLH